MASGLEELPPPLPVKQHRRASLSAVPGPARLQHDAFAEPIDCLADQCPIHPDPSRLPSSDTPPPVPKKRLTRSMSLPVTAAPHLNAFKTFRKHLINFGNPLAPITPEEADEAGPIKSDNDSALSELTFDTPDRQLLVLFGSLSDQRFVSQRIQRHQQLFLRRAAQSLVADLLIGERASDVYAPQDFFLSEDREPKQLGDSIYYDVHSPKFPGRELALRVRKTSVTSDQTERLHPPHVSVRDVIAVFRDDDGTPATAIQPHGGGSDPTSPKVEEETVASLLEEGLLLSVERDLPDLTLEDFIREGGEGLVHDRRLCVLLLQVMTGCQHLQHTSTSTPELRPRDIHLTWPGANSTSDGETSVQMLWRSRGSPRLVLPPRSSPRSLTSLIQECLAKQDGATAATTPSPYRRGLLWLASLLRGEGPPLGDMAALLQVLLWGPGAPLLQQGSSGSIHSWLAVKRALLVMKLAERGLTRDQSVLDWEDFLCLQFFSSADPESVVDVGRRLSFALNEEL